jgi:hypothetical protein
VARLKLFKKGKHYTVDVEILKRALRELVEREPAFFRDLMLDVLRSDGGAAEALLELLTRHPEARLRLAQAVAGSIAVPLNVATKDDIKAAVEELKRWAEEKFATKEDLKQFATKEDLKQFATKEERLEDNGYEDEKFGPRGGEDGRGEVCNGGSTKRKLRIRWQLRSSLKP